MAAHNSADLGQARGPSGGQDAIDGIEQLADGRRVLKVRVRAPASEGEANTALVKLIAKTLGVARRSRIHPTSATLKVPNSGKPEFGREVSLIAGASARLKRVKVAGAAAALATALEKICALE
jgi:uncharacterized protein YggU (UPF0235/DUF167 family)